jgi:class 3 adenylate cyclase
MFLFTDIEGSTRLWETHPQAMQDAVVRHDRIYVVQLRLTPARSSKR